MLAVNLTGIFLPSKYAVRAMKPRKQGTIVITSSAGALAAYPGWFAYGASKGGINSLVRHMAWALGSYGIRVNALCPTHGMSPNLLLPPDAPVVGQSYEEVAGPWDPAVSPIPFKASAAAEPARQRQRRPVPRFGRVDVHVRRLPAELRRWHAVSRSHRIRDRLGDAGDEHGLAGRSGGRRLVKAAPFTYHAPDIGGRSRRRLR